MFFCLCQGRFTVHFTLGKNWFPFTLHSRKTKKIICDYSLSSFCNAKMSSKNLWQNSLSKISTSISLRKITSNSSKVLTSLFLLRGEHRQNQCNISMQFMPIFVTTLRQFCNKNVTNIFKWVILTDLLSEYFCNKKVT